MLSTMLKITVGRELHQLILRSQKIEHRLSLYVSSELEQKIFDDRINIINSAENVGRLFMYFKNAPAGGPHILCCGTAFFVSPNIIATAAHNIRKLNTSVCVMQLDKCYFDTAVNAETDPIASFGFTRDVMPLTAKVLYGADVISVVQDKDPLTGVEWKFIDDFAFLQVESVSSKTFFIPDHKIEPNNIHTITGYGSTPKNVSDVYPVDNLSDFGVNKPITLSSCCPDFKYDIKTVSYGTLEGEVYGLILATNAAAVPGFSGSPVSKIGFANRFSGIYIGGSPKKDGLKAYDLNHNLAISVNHPLFKQAYSKFVYPTIPMNTLSDDIKNSILDYIK